MRLHVLAVLAAISVASIDAAAADAPLHYLTLVNRAHDSVTALSIAPTGSDAFRPLPLHAPLRGGGGSTTLEIAGEQCRHDVRVSFRDDRVQLYRAVDVCRQRGLRLRPPSRDAAGPALRLAQSPVARMH